MTIGPSPPDSPQSPCSGDRAQSEVLGMVLLLGLAIASTGFLIVAGAPALENHQNTVEQETAKNELSLVAAQSSEVALGDASVRRVKIGNHDGEYAVNANSGWLKIEHINRTDGSTEEIENVSLGAVVYMDGNVEIAYQGGGVWSQVSGRTTMVSPPEFHYRGGTLTLPIINIGGEGQSTNPSEISLRRDAVTERIYPNPSRSYPDDNTSFANPIKNGTIRVTVHGDYYEGWGAYFDKRTEGEVSVDAANQTAMVELVTFGDMGHTELQDGEAINLRGAMGEKPINEFNLTLVGDGSSALNNLDWSLEIDGDVIVNAHGKGSGDVDVTITAPNGTEWVTEDPFKAEEDQEQVEISLGSERNVTHDGKKREIGGVFNEIITAHGPDVDLVVEDKSGSQRVDHDNSHAYLDYDGNGAVITYLHITENGVKVRFTGG